MTCVFLENGRDMLLIKRADSMSVAPGFWAGVGGHLEPEEVNDPAKCALREVEEETGITADQIRDLRLQAILQRQRADEIRIQYVYLGITETRDVGTTAEGTLCWVPRDEVLDRPMSAANRFFLERYFSHGSEGVVWVGTLGNDGGRPLITWAVLEDWELG
ncbi:MAG: NUDIX domain-containing protein [Alicyclobacillus sp.]|nr:NUDIX domain-containing protein [Alicyclobacillus sp.]